MSSLLQYLLSSISNLEWHFILHLYIIIIFNKMFLFYNYHLIKWRWKLTICVFSKVSGQASDYIWRICGNTVEPLMLHLHLLCMLFMFLFIPHTIHGFTVHLTCTLFIYTRFLAHVFACSQSIMSLKQIYASKLGLFTFATI